MRDKRGFTLIELSIVVIIIGLVAGGVLFGNDLIIAAKVRGQVSQIQNYKTAVNVFKMKYGFYPGDMPASHASAYGFTARSGAENHGDGDGLIKNCNGSTSGGVYVGCEQTMLWNDLSSAQLINETFNTATDDVVTATADELYKYNPVSKIGVNSYVTASYKDAQNRFTVLGWLGLVAGTAVGNKVRSNISPMEAFNIDSKMDDGKPLTGNVKTSPTTPATQASGVCITTENGNPYNISNKEYANVPSCNMWFFW